MAKNKTINYYLGMEIVNSCINGYEKRFDFSKIPQIMKDNINPEKTYSVLEEINYWDYYGSLMGDSEGEEHIIFHIEETPDFVLELFEKMGQLEYEKNKYEKSMKLQYEELQEV